MRAATSCPVLLCADSAVGADVRAALEQAGLQVTLAPALDREPVNGSAPRLILIDGAAETDGALKLCHRLRSRFDDPFVPILFLAAGDAAGLRRASLECGADSFLPRPFEPVDLVAHARALLRLKDRHDQLTAKASETHRINKRLQAAYQLIDQELELARRVQESFLPQTLPQLANVRLAARYRLCGRVGGDFYDVFRLDEHHLGMYVADAMGHGVAASLLTIFVKTSVQPKDIDGQSYRLVPPNEVLERLNRAMIGQALSETPFITMAYALFNWQTGMLSFARAGHPYPLYLPREGPPTLWQIEGSLLGVFDTRYQVQTHELQPGDKVLLYTDGMDGASFAAHPVGLPSLLAAAEQYRRLPIDELVGRLSSDVFGQTRQTDDLTVLGLEML
ncbi:MAG: SpoIIE family protein phosphatase [Gemmataceae bacterium]|nr:SpoIIE family protein phosphatase [Gemmataceae bacterium]